MLHSFLPLTVAKLATLKNSQVYFGPPCISMLVDFVRSFVVQYGRVWKVAFKRTGRQHVDTNHVTAARVPGSKIVVVVVE